MKTREDIWLDIDQNNSDIEELNNVNKKLLKESYLLCDEEQWFEEKEETRGRGKSKETNLVGRIHWKEFFQDDAYPNDESKGVWVERSMPVKWNGVWVD